MKTIYIITSFYQLKSIYICINNGVQILLNHFRLITKPDKQNMNAFFFFLLIYIYRDPKC